MGAKIPSFNYAPIDLRLGLLAAEPFLDGTLLRGHPEVLLDLMAAPVVTHYGHFVGGTSLLFRYNYIPADWCVIPYWQGGVGLAYTDANRDQNQRAIGQSVEFLLQAGAGFRYVLSENWTLEIEGGFQHISNANLAGRNAGTNDLGAAIGLTYYFRSGR
jgi:hypothetical protein